MSNYQPVKTKNNTPYGLHIPYNQGYDARSRRNAPVASSQTGASGYFSRADGASVDVWIEEISADFSLSGQTGQSRMVREFFPRSFNDVTITITGRTASTQEHNRLAMFIRETHWVALNDLTSNKSASPTIQFGLHNNTPKAWGKHNVKGGHIPWLLEGYIKSMAAGAVRHEVAPQFQIGFIVAYSTQDKTTGLWGDEQVKGKSLTDILSLINAVRKKGGGKGFVNNPTPAIVTQGTGLLNPIVDVAQWTTVIASQLFG